MDSSTCANWRKFGTIIWTKTIYHHGSMFFIIPLWSVSTSGILDLCVSSVSRIPLVMSGIPCVALSPPLFREHISWRASTGKINSFKRNGEYCWDRTMNVWANIFDWKVCCAWHWFLCVKGYHSLVGFWCLHSCSHQEAQILSQGCTSRFHWAIIRWKRCYLCEYVGGHNCTRSWG